MHRHGSGLSTLRSRLNFSAVALSAFLAACASLALGHPLAAADKPAGEQRFERLFSPLRSMSAALSPDGKHLAYSLREKGATSVLIVEIDRPTVVKASVVVGTDQGATAMFSDDRERTPSAIGWMCWVTPNRLVIQNNQRHRTHDGVNWASVAGSIIALDADGKNARTLVSPRDVGGFARADTVGPSRLMQPPSFLSDMHSDTPEASWNWPRLGPTRTVENGPLFPNQISQVRIRSRPPRVFDLSPTDPESVIVAATEGLNHAYFSVNVVTGKIRNLREFNQDPATAALFDRRGQPRIAVPDTKLARPPFRYGLEKNFGLGRWRPLDSLVGAATGPGFWFSVDNYFGERSIPLAFDDNPDLLYYASNIGRDTYGIYALDLKTGRRTDLAFEDPAYDLVALDERPLIDPRTLIFDRYTRQLAGIRYQAGNVTARWLRPEFREIQSTLEQTFSGRSVEIQEWDAAMNRFLISVYGPGDPGGTYIFDRALNKLYEFFRRSPQIDAEKPYRVLAFSLENPAGGGRLTGLLTIPHVARLKNIPVVVYCRPDPWRRSSAGFNRELQAFSAMGFAVLQIDGRGTQGYGIRQREALKQGYERAQLEDTLTVVDRLAVQLRIDPKRVALVGDEHGAYLALRGVQLHPDRFRCAVALNAAVDLAGSIEERRWGDEDTRFDFTQSFLGDAATLREAPLVNHPEKIDRPIFLLNYPGPEGGPRTQAYLDAKRFASAVARTGAAVEFVELEREYVRQLPRAKAAVFRRIEEFLNTHLYDYAVKLEPLRSVELDVAR